MASLGSTNLDCRQRGEQLDPSRREFYIFNSGIAGIEEADAILLIGTNPRQEAPVLNARIRKRWLAAGIPIGVIGAAADLTYPVQPSGRTRSRGDARRCGARLLAGCKAKADGDPGRRRDGAAGWRGDAGGGLEAGGGGQAR